VGFPIQVGVIDYGAGNVSSVMHAVERTGAYPKRVSTPEDIIRCDRLILPGVGAAQEAMRSLKRLDLIEALDEAVNKKATPLLGICVGMQILAEKLTEFGESFGLGWIEGQVLPLSNIGKEKVQTPHMGWSHVSFKGAGEYWSKLVGRRSEFYFAHSYALVVNDPSLVAATVFHGYEITSAISKGSIIATQFHPEKSQVPGATFMEAFVDWSP
jgi:imidazole glycerol-phosphate synthase subunit HisH